MTALTAQNILSLPYVSLRDPKRIPTMPGVYCVIHKREEVIYVGMTTRSIRQRLARHHKQVSFDGLDDLTVAVILNGDAAEIERAAIAALAPRLNRYGTLGTDIARQSFRMPAWLRDEVDAVARQREVTRSATIIEAVLAWLPGQQGAA